MTDVKTRKLAVPLKGRDHLVPAPEQLGGSGFRTLRTNRPVEQGLVAYIGTDVGPDDLLRSMDNQLRTALPDSDWGDLLRGYLAAIQSFKIGNVLAAAVEAGEVRLHLRCRRPTTKTKPRLPQ